MTCFVLVHGGCHGAECWDAVEWRLRARGHAVVAVALPGHGQAAFDAGRRATLEDGIAVTVAAVEATGEAVVLVGHSLGGMTISGVAEAIPRRIRRLVYVSALLPRNGESAADLTRYPDFRAGEGSFLYDGGEWVGVRRDLARALFYADCDDAVAAKAMDRLSPTDTAFITGAVRLSDERFGAVPRLYISCLRDGAIGIGAQRAMIADNPGTAVVELDCGHSPFLAMPETLADCLEVA